MRDDEHLSSLGEPLPDFALVGPTGLLATFSSVREGNVAIAYFLRAATCPVCLSHAHALVRLKTSGALGKAMLILIAPGNESEARILSERVTSSAASKWASGSAHALSGMGKFLSLQHSGIVLVSETGRVLYRRTALLPPLSFSEKELREALLDIDLD